MSDAAKLDRASIEDIMALTPTQEGLLYHYRSGMDEDSYVQQLSIRFAGELQMDVLRAAWRHVAQANEMLRTVFRWEKLEHPVQIVLREPNIQVEERDCSAHTAEEREKLVADAVEEERNRPADLTAAPLRVLVCVLDNHQFEMIVSWHHILFDGWSNGILLKEFMQAYDACLSGKEPNAPRKTRFKEFVSWLQKGDREASQLYWKEELAGFADRAVLPLSTGAGAEAARRKVPGTFSAPIPPEMIAQLTDYARGKGVTAATVLYGVWALLLHKYSGAGNVIFGTTVSGRTPELDNVEEMIGLFINTVPLRVTIDENVSAEQVILAVDAAIRRREAYESTPITDIAAWSGAGGADGLFETIVVLDNYPLDASALRCGSLTATDYQMRESTHYKLTLGIHTFGEWMVDFDYDAATLSASDIERMAGHYLHLLDQIVHQPLRQVGDLDLVTPSEREIILTRFNRSIEKSSQKLAHHVFEEQASANPTLIAVISGGQSFTYGDINARAERLARRLRRETFKSGERLVALFAERSDEWIVAMLAVLKAGCGYIPIDNAYAPARIAYMLEDSAAEVLLIGDGLEAPLTFTGRVVQLSGAASYEGDSSDTPLLNTTEEQIAYVTYTSGSTGAPKGVMTEHRQLLAYVHAFQQEFNLGPGDVVLQQASCSFDHFVEEVYPTLLSGATIVIAKREDVLDPDRLVQLLQTSGVTVVTIQPLLLSELNKRGGVPGVHTYLSGGDVLKAAHYDQLVDKARVYNTYGPTEATVCATYWRCDPEVEKNIPIGSPIAGYNVYIADRRGKLQPIGIPGEICISGNGVARGYLRNPELTKSKFVPDPYRPGETMYRTGDVGVWQEDGTIRFEGRNDEQVKIRGYRIDLREIELALQGHEAITEAFVMATDDAAGEKQIAAYVAIGREMTAYELREHLSDKLPAHMFPSVYYRIAAIPRTGNEKADKQALLRCTDRLPSGRVGVESQSETENAVIAVWRDVLKLAEIGPDDHFFDIGGNSLLLMTLQAKLERAFSAGITVTDLFSLPTVSKQAEWLDNRLSRREAYPIDGYQPLPEDCFEPRWSKGEAIAGQIQLQVPLEVVAALDRLAAECSVERYDILASMWGYLFAEAAGQRSAVFHAAVQHGALAIRLDLDTLHDFTGLFASVSAKLRNAGASGVIPLERVDRFIPERAPSDTLPFLCRSSAVAESERIRLLSLYDLMLIVEDTSTGKGLGLTLQYQKGRFQQGTPEWLTESYLDLLRQLSGTGVVS
ncbi:amino acid adenylation domain protein [Paenibacillus curdlanolyticus YK9]|uniref:Amino acid adenylation domain protein n=1 Tax=Paenibacillus curdlanolyticus YK9 TaxID=717606 RepID=E0IGA0_9BACL|nr:non-ribosomal peptide synthetase [Paenibacillus curdlanolyticus]EFM08502.1 amino acid adenylation domain protein [Paenibacillus curdlanolyticus YK9]